MNLNFLQQIQEKLARQVLIIPVWDVGFIVGVDVAYARERPIAAGAAVVMRFPDLKIVEQRILIQKVDFPYIPYYFAFRELPVILRLLKSLKVEFQLVFCEGHGLSHPRRCGLATHLGVILQKPTIGIAKKRLIGYADIPELKRGNYSLLKTSDEIIGALVCTQDNIKSLFVSIGNRITLKEAIQFTLKTATQYRLPEPIRQAHLLANKALKSYVC